MVHDKEVRLMHSEPKTMSGMELLSRGIYDISKTTARREFSVSPKKIPKINAMDNLVNMDISLEDKRSEEEELKKKASSLFLDTWWGRLLPCYKSNIREYSRFIEDKFSMEDTGLKRSLKEDAVRMGSVDKCPHLLLALSDIRVFKLSKKTHRYYLEIFLSSDPDQKEIVDADEDVSTQLKFYFEDIDDVESLSLDLSLWKVGTFETSQKGHGSIPLSLTNGEGILKWDNREVSRLNVELRRKNLDSSFLPVARRKIPNLLRDHFKEVLIDDAVFKTSNKDAKMPKYFLEFSEVRIGEAKGEVETRLQFKNEIEDDIDGNRHSSPPSLGSTLRFEMTNLIKDSLRVSLYDLDKETEIFAQEKKVVDWVSPVGNCNEIVSEHVSKTTFRWNFNIVRDSNEEEGITSDVGENLFFMLYNNHLESILSDAENDTVLLDWDGLFEPKYENLIKITHVHDPQKNQWKTEKLKALLKLHTKYHFNNFVLTPLLGPAHTLELGDDSNLKLYIEYAAYHLSFYVTVGNYNKLPLNQLKALLANLLILNDEREKKVFEILEPKMSQKIKEYHDLSNLSNHKIVLEQSILPSLRGTVRLFDSLGSKWAEVLARIYLDLSLPILKELLSESLCDSTNGLLTYNIFVKSRTLSTVVEGKDNEVYLQRVYAVFKGCLDSWVDCSIEEANKQVTRVLKMERNKHNNATNNNNNNTKKQEYSTDIDDDDVYEGILEGAIDIEGIFDTCRFVWNEIQWPVPAENIRFGDRLLEGLHSLYSRYITEFNDILKHSDNDPSMSTDELITILNSTYHSVTYLSKFQSSINSLIDKHSDEDYEVASQIGDFVGTLALAYQETESRTEELMDHYCLSQEPIISEYIRRGGIHGDGSSGDQTSLHYVDISLETLNNRLNTGEDKVDARLLEFLKEKLMKLHENLVFKYYESLKTEYDRKGRNPEVFQKISKGIPHMIGFRRTLSMEDNPDILSLQDELYPKSYSSAVLIYQHLRSVVESDNNSKAMASVRLEISVKEEDGNSFLNVDLRSISGVVPKDGKDTSNFSLSLALLPSNKLTRVRTGIYAESLDVLFDFISEDEEPPKHVYSLELDPLDKEEKFLSIELFDHSGTFPTKYFRGWGLIPLTYDEEVKVYQELKLLPVDVSALDAVECQELSKRKDKIAKEYIYRLQKYAHGKTIHLNPMTNRQEWIKAR